MSGSDASSTPLRAGETWTDGEYVALIDFLRHGVDLESIAAALDRSTTAISAQFRNLVPLKVDSKQADIERWLREQLAAGDYDWRKALTDQYRAQGRHFFTDDQDVALRQAWQDRRPLSVIADQIRATEMQVARRLISLGVAVDTAQVAQTLEVTTGSAIDIRARLAADRAASSVWILIVDRTRGDIGKARHLDIRRNVSVHASEGDAQEERDRILATHNRHTPGVPVTWSIAQRTVGEGTAGADRHGSH